MSTEAPIGGEVADRPRRLMVDLQPDPVGVGTTECRLSWWVPTTGSQQQERFQVQFAESVPDLEAGATLWDSGERPGQQSAGVRISGLALPPCSVLWWRVRTWSVGSERPSPWSDAHRLVTAADASDWPAEGVWAPGLADAELASWALLRVEENLPEGDVVAAIVEVCALSPENARQYVAKTWVNGEVAGRSSVRAIGDEARYHTHDVTASVRAGQPNVLAALCWAEDGRSLTARLTVTYGDGRTHVVTSSPRWRALDGSQLLPGTATIKGGWYRAPRECWDMRHEPAGWTLPGFDDADWPHAVPRPNSQPLRPAVVDLEQHEVRPALVERRGAGEWFIDLGAEIVGGLRLEIDAPETLTIGVVLGEELRADGSILSPLRTGNVYEETWTLRHGPQVIEHWGFRGFRYVEVTDCPVDLTSALTAFALHAPVETDEQARGSFRCSDPDLERVWDLSRRTIEVTGSDVYVDTAVRERGPYEGDMWVNQLSQYAVGGGWALARYSGEYLTRRPTWPSEYQLMPVLCGWVDYLATGDDRQLHTDYEHWRRSTFAHELDQLGLVRRDNPRTGWGRDLVDWPPTYRDGHVFGDVNTVLNAFQCAAYEALARVAEVLGKSDDHALCTARAATMRAAITEHLLDRDRGRYRDGEAIEHSSQHSTVMPVALGLAPPEELARLGHTLVGQGVRTSIYAVQFLLDALYLAGEDDAALKVMTSHGAPGWIDVMDRLGATLTPEAWDPEQKPNMTFSHAWGTAPANVIARHLVGVQVVEPGAARVTIRPQPGTLSWFDAVVPTIRGPVAVAMSQDDEVRRLTVRLPANMVGTVQAPMSWVASGEEPPVRECGPGVTELAVPVAGSWS